jgi:hypothetical protein
MDDPGLGRRRRGFAHVHARHRHGIA